MNINEAKEQIKYAMTAYFAKNKYGDYIIPIEKQRPVLLMGPPGIGKTAIMEQIAAELDVALLSYSMTHHTRQSALGLPYITQKKFDGQEYSVSEYTMSEIIVSVYELMEETGKKEGILFLDEINCVSETLAPSMLQFMQYKVFGRHKVPPGWIIVTAGNPPEYNDSVREFDIVTLDRLKRINIEPDYECWKKYAYTYGIHPAIITYLDIKRDDFYKIETTVDGKTFVTARGWSDLSDMIAICEEKNMPVNEMLICQYLQCPKTAKEFAAYYDLFVKYKSDYQIDKILAGKSEGMVDRAKSAPFDERLALLSLLLDGVMLKIRDVLNNEKALSGVSDSLSAIMGNMDLESSLTHEENKIYDKIEKGRKASSLNEAEVIVLRTEADILKQMRESFVENSGSDFKVLKDHFNKLIKEFKKSSAKPSKELNNAFDFCEQSFGDGQEMLIFVTELTTNPYSLNYIARYGCDKYYEHNGELLFYEKQKDILKELGEIE